MYLIDTFVLNKNMKYSSVQLHVHERMFFIWSAFV